MKDEKKKLYYFYQALVAYIEHCFYKNNFIRECIKNKWCSREHFEDVVDIRKIESEEFENEHTGTN
ncbi:hypothetical protein [Streptococcus mitis]|uniref:hypothetical protein n=1 Tax=Streptococcus mitis TaxID=28037 RepID=UPI0021B778CB|nr:hypothetical protein [Streptococcus mitis]